MFFCHFTWVAASFIFVMRNCGTHHKTLISLLYRTSKTDEHFQRSVPKENSRPLTSDTVPFYGPMMKSVSSSSHVVFEFVYSHEVVVCLHRPLPHPHRPLYGEIVSDFSEIFPKGGGAFKNVRGTPSGGLENLEITPGAKQTCSNILLFFADIVPRDPNRKKREIENNCEQG